MVTASNSTTATGEATTTTVDTSTTSDLQTNSAFAKSYTESTPAAKVTKGASVTAQEGFFDPANPDSINGFKDAQLNGTNNAAWTALTDRQSHLTDYSAMDANGNLVPMDQLTNAPGYTENETAYSFDVTNNNTLGKTVAFNKDLSSYDGSSSAYASVLAMQDSYSGTSTDKGNTNSK